MRRTTDPPSFGAVAVLLYAHCTQARVLTSWWGVRNCSVGTSVCDGLRIIPASGQWRYSCMRTVPWLGFLLRGGVSVMVPSVLLYRRTTDHPRFRAMAVLLYAHCTGAQVVNAPQGERAPIIKITSATIPWVLAPAISQRWWGSSPLAKGRLGELIWIVGPCIAPPHVRHIPESRPAMSLISSLISLNLEDREHTLG